MWRQLVEREVSLARIRVVDLNLEAGTVTYSRRIRQHRPILSISHDREIVRADLVNRFVNEMGYDPEYIELDRPVSVTRSDGASATETVDVVVNHRDGSPFFFAAVKTPESFHEDDGTAARLIRLAEAELAATGKAVRHLFFYTVVVKGTELASESVILNFEHFRHGEEAFSQQVSDSQEPDRPAAKWCCRQSQRRRVIQVRYKKHRYRFLLR